MISRSNHLLALLAISALLFSCGREGRDRSPGSQTAGTNLPTPPIETEVTLPEEAKVKIYFENTLSMDGYITGHTGFKDVFRELLVAVDNEDAIEFETEFFLINDEIFKEDFNVSTTKISEKLTPSSTRKGNKSSSHFEVVLNKVLENQDTNTISILMADFIYSPGEGTDTPSALNKLKTYTKEAFLKAGINEMGMETRIYRFTSNFDGTYYDINNKKIPNIQTRPYYYFVTAPSALISVFEKEVSPQIKKNEDFEHEMILSVKSLDHIENLVLTATLNNGRFRYNNGLEIRDYPREGPLEIAVAVNLQDIPVNQEYLLDKNNYTSSPFTVKNIGILEGGEINFEDKDPVKVSPTNLLNLKQGTYTHVLLLSSDEMVSEDLVLTLDKNIPQWVYRVNSDDDRNIESDSTEKTRTFGFSHLVEGVSTAYSQRTGSSDYFTLRIPVIQ